MNSRNNNSKDKEMKQTKSNLVLEKIKSDYFLMKLLDIMKKNRMFEIVKYNKKLQKRLNLSINDYKEYFNEYTSIEIELRVKNDRDYENKFINIPYRNEKHYHIYFDNSSEEINRNYLEKDEKVETIKIIIDNPITSFRRLFYECGFVVSVFFKKFNRKNITDMSDMFSFGIISSIKKLDLSNFKTDNVKNMSGMFNGCYFLEELDLSNFNTNNVTNMSGMFKGCQQLKELNISNFKTNNVTNMSSMFFLCHSLEGLDLSNFNTNNVTNMKEMFYGCSSLEELDLSNFNTNKVTDMSCMFAGCSSLEELDISNFNTINVKKMKYMFSSCSKELKEKIKEIINIDD